MGRSMLGVKFLDWIRKEELRRKTKFTNAIERITHSKLSCAGHDARMSEKLTDEENTRMVSQRRSTQKQERTTHSMDGRLEKDIFTLDPRCPRPSKWSKLREDYVQQWTGQPALWRWSGWYLSILILKFVRDSFSKNWENREEINWFTYLFLTPNLKWNDSLTKGWYKNCPIAKTQFPHCWDQLWLMSVLKTGWHY